MASSAAVNGTSGYTKVAAGMSGIDMAATSPVSGLSDDDSDGRAGGGGGRKYPRFGMNKGTRIIPGQINWKGTYVDQSMFFKVINLKVWFYNIPTDSSHYLRHMRMRITSLIEVLWQSQY